MRSHHSKLGYGVFEDAKSRLLRLYNMGRVSSSRMKMAKRYQISFLLDAYKEKLEFPELKRAAYEKYWEYEPDQMIVEAKAAGSPFIFELRAMGIPVTEFTPSRGQDKIARVNAVSDLFASGVIWAPATRWAEEVIEECAAFPAGEHDDLVDSTTQASAEIPSGRLDQKLWMTGMTNQSTKDLSNTTKMILMFLT